MEEHIKQSNLIEGINDPAEDSQSMIAWDYLAKQKHVGMSELLKTHQLITVRQLEPRYSGHFRDVPVWVGGHETPSPTIAMSIIHSLLIDLRQNPHWLNPKKAHVQFEKAHPFIDGNGRTGRMLMWWHEKQLGIKPTLLLADERGEYYKWFKEGEK